MTGWRVVRRSRSAQRFRTGCRAVAPRSFRRKRQGPVDTETGPFRRPVGDVLTRLDVISTQCPPRGTSFARERLWSQMRKKSFVWVGGLVVVAVAAFLVLGGRQKTE